MKPLVIFHAGCADGFCAAWVARKKLGDADYVAANYGESPPDVTGREVYILDFSYKRPVTIEMSQTAAKLVVLDHHRTAEMELLGLSAGSNEGLIRFDMDKSGGRLAWEYFFRGKPAPWLVEYTEDRDLWRWKLPHSKELSAYIRSFPFDFAIWDSWNDPGSKLFDTFVEAGAAILRYQDGLVEAAVKVAAEIEMDGHKILAVNTTCLNSEIGERLAEGRPFSATFFIKGDGKKVWSLRSRGESGIDVSEIAKRHGGGGHKQAAGFTE